MGVVAAALDHLKVDLAMKREALALLGAEEVWPAQLLDDGVEVEGPQIEEVEAEVEGLQIEEEEVVQAGVEEHVSAEVVAEALGEALLPLLRQEC